MKIPFSKPYQYTATKGNLLIETFNKDPYVYSRWSADGIRESATAGGGEEGYLGFDCMGTGGNVLDFSAIDEHALMPGGSLDTTFKLTNLTGAVAWLGTSRTAFGPLTLPFDLSPLGAPGCMIHTDMAHLVTVPTTGKVVWPIPNNPYVINQLFYVQGAGTATNANTLGLVAVPAPCT